VEKSEEIEKFVLLHSHERIRPYMGIKYL